ncbi:thiamine-binding protein [Ralstonia pickettii]|uniref:thiamine-binding protein n=1 Tax=Ralstonia pickettii TaxID=329 RepID=UPI001C666B48
MLVAFSVAPSGTGREDGSVHDAVAAAVRIVRDSGLPHRTTSMFTEIEGEWDDVFDVVRRATNPAMVGAPMTTPSAYRLMSQPAWAIASPGAMAHVWGSRSCATFGNRPMTTNSPMPIAKLPMAKERSAAVAAPFDI